MTAPAANPHDERKLRQKLIVAEMLGDGMEERSDRWMGLMIGNSRLHWAVFHGGDRQLTWDTPHLTAAQVRALIQTHLQPSIPADAAPEIGAELGDLPWPQLTKAEPFPAPLPLWIATVVPSQAQLWHRYPALVEVNPHDLPIAGLYPTLGSDRILNLWAGRSLTDAGVLVIDGGTAMTVSGLTARDEFGGGAIWPGLRLQFQALHQQTAALPLLTAGADRLDLPDLWGYDTPTAIRSGILHGAIASVSSYIIAWCDREPQSRVILTGGDGEWLERALRHHFTATGNLAIGNRLRWIPQLGLTGIAAYRAWIQSHRASSARVD